LSKEGLSSHVDGTILRETRSPTFTGVL
jgi:hypothetical protein